MFRSIRWQIAFPFALAAAASILLFGFYTAERVYDSEIEGFSVVAMGQTEFVAGLLEAVAENSADTSTTTEAILSQAHAQLFGTEFILIAPSGAILASQPEIISTIYPIEIAPEIQSALNGTTAYDLRLLPGDTDESMLVAAPVRENGQVAAVLQGTYSTAPIVAVRRNIRVVTLLATLLMSITSWSWPP